MMILSVSQVSFGASQKNRKKLLKYLKEHPEAGTGDVLLQICDVILPEIMEDDDEDDEEAEDSD